MIIVSPVVPVRMTTNLDKDPEFEKKKESLSGDGFKELLHNDMRELGSTNPEKEIADYYEAKNRK